MERRKSAIIDLLQNSLYNEDLQKVNNAFCEKNSDPDGIICNNDCDTIDERLSSMTPSMILMNGEHYSHNDDYFKITIYGIKSFDDIAKEIDINDIADGILRDERILTDSLDLCDYERHINCEFQDFLDDSGITRFYDFSLDYSADDLLTRSWEDDLLPEIISVTEEM